MCVAAGGVAGVRPVRVHASAVAGRFPSRVDCGWWLVVGVAGPSGWGCAVERLTRVVLSCCEHLRSCIDIM